MTSSPGTANNGCFWLACAFNDKDELVLRVGQGHGIRIHNSLSKAKTQRKRWRNGARNWRNGPLTNYYPNSKVYQGTYVAGVMMLTEVDCED